MDMTETVNKNRLGKTGINVSRISFGTVSLGLPYGIRAQGQPQMPAESESISLLRKARERGVNFYDTALAYGISEAIVGKAFTDCRDKVVICTKPAHLFDMYAGQTLPPDGEITTHLEQSLQQSLKLLNTDYIDIYMSHDGAEEVIDNDTVVGFYQQLKQQGVIRATGISVYTVEQSLKAIRSGVWDVVQLAFNMMDQTQSPAIELAAERGVGIVVRSVLLKGVLTKKGDHLHPALKSVQEHRKKYLPFLNNDINTLSDLATRFVLSCKGVSSVLVGFDKLRYLESALSTLQLGELNQQLVETIKKCAYPDPGFLDLPKWDRMGWL